MAQKKILLLGGSMQQIPSIKKAKELGIPVITEEEFLSMIE